MVFNDINGKGSEVGDAALPGQTVFLDLDGDSSVDATEPTMLTDANGAYAFQIPEVTVATNLHVALALPASESTGCWQNTNNNYLHDQFRIGPRRLPCPSVARRSGCRDDNLANIVEEISQQLVSGNSEAIELILAEHPNEAGRLRALLPTLRVLVEIGSSPVGNHRLFRLGV